MKMLRLRFFFGDLLQPSYRCWCYLLIIWFGESTETFAEPELLASLDKTNTAPRPESVGIYNYDSSVFSRDLVFHLEYTVFFAEFPDDKTTGVPSRSCTVTNRSKSLTHTFASTLSQLTHSP